MGFYSEAGRNIGNQASAAIGAIAARGLIKSGVEAGNKDAIESIMKDKNLTSEDKVNTLIQSNIDEEGAPLNEAFHQQDVKNQMRFKDIETEQQAQFEMQENVNEQHRTELEMAQKAMKRLREQQEAKSIVGQMAYQRRQELIRQLGGVEGDE